jgi:Family of unknown function (DUF6502)
MTRSSADKTNIAHFKNGVLAALTQICEPLADFILESGLSVREAQQIIRKAAISAVAKRQLERSGRVNISGISAATGIPRGEVSKVLSQAGRTAAREPGREQSTHRVLAAWRADSKYRSASGNPAPLKMYGRGASFESLAKTYGKGLSARAILDELLRTQAARIDREQVVFLTTLVAVERGVNSNFVKVFAQRVAELMSTMLHNRRHPEKAAFVASVAEGNFPANEIPRLHRSVAATGSNFLGEIQKMLVAAASKITAETADADASIRVTVYVHESTGSTARQPLDVPRRKNLRRGRN